MTHDHAPLAPFGRQRLARLIVEDGCNVRRAAERLQCSSATAVITSLVFDMGESHQRDVHYVLRHQFPMTRDMGFLCPEPTHCQPDQLTPEIWAVSKGRGFP